MLTLLLESIVFVLPIYFANGFATLSMHVPIIKNWKTPIDLGRQWNGKRLLGKGKTIRGFLFGVMVGLLGGLIQYYLTQKFEFKYFDFLDKNPLNKILLLSFLLGFGALFGDSVKSFFKRRVGIESGRPWPVFDQLDFIVGALLFGSIIYFPGWEIALTIIIITPLMHLLSNVTAYKLGIKDVWW